MAVQVLGKVAYFNKGAYNSETNYEINDVVSYNGSSYVSLNDNNQGNLPTNTNYWSVVAEKGDKGDTGKPFVIEKTYSTIESMVADYDNMNVNDYVMIQGSIEEQENATLWTKREVEVSPYKWAYLADFSGASGITGATPNIHIGTVTEGNEPSVTRRSGSSNENPILDFVLKTGAKGDTGATGNGISSLEKTSTSGLVDTYTITFTNGTSTTIEVTNGRGIVSIAKTSSVDYVDTYTITYNDGTISTFEVANSEVTEEEFDDVVDELNYLYDDLPKVEGEGTNLTLDDTRKGKMSNVLKGNDLSQFTTTGKNKLNSLGTYSAGTTRTSNGITYTFNEDGSITINGTATGTSFALLVGENLNNYQTERFRIDEDYVVGNWSNANIQLITRGTDGEYRTIYKGSNPDIANIKNIPIGVIFVQIVINATVNETIYPQIELGNTQTSYEKFTGGNPSPNPDYPQDVHVVSGNNTIRIESKNLFNPTYEVEKQYDAYGNERAITYYSLNNGVISVSRSNNTYGACFFNKLYLEAGTYTFNVNMSQSGNTTTNVRARIRNFDTLTDIVITNVVVTSNKWSYTFTLTKPSTIGLMSLPSSDSDGTLYLSNVQLEKGSEVTDFYPYVSQTYSINLGTMELCKIGDYQDYIYKDNGKWYKHSEIGKQILDGTESWIYSVSNLVFYSDVIQTPQVVKNSTRFYCNRFSYVSWSTSFENMLNGQGRYQADGNHRLILKNTAYTTSDDFKNWLSNNNTSVYYVLATPTNTEITDQTLIAQLDNFEKALSYNTQTNISQENNDLPFIISASAFMSLKYIFVNLETRVAELEG